jgi:hypothetical protein
MRPSGPLLSFFSETETEPSSITSVADDIQRRITEMNRGTQKYRQKISQMRNRISTRHQSLSGILASLGFPQSRPSVPSLTRAISELEARIASGTKELTAILGSEAFTSACALESKIHLSQEESDKLNEAIREAEEDMAAALHDLEAAKGRLASTLGKSTIRDTKAGIATLTQNFGEQHKRTLNATDMLVESDDEINARIQSLEGTLYAERMSASRAHELEQESAVTLREVASDAGQRIRAALS